MLSVSDKRDSRKPSDQYGEIDTRLRLGGVYRLPDGSEAVAGVVGGGGRHFLYHPLVWKGKAWIVNMPVAFELEPDGSVVTGKGSPTGWSAEDLVDTGRTVGSGETANRGYTA